MGTDVKVGLNHTTSSNLEELHSTMPSCLGEHRTNPQGQGKKKILCRGQVLASALPLIKLEGLENMFT